MGEMISKPDANPIVLAVMNVLICSLPIGYFMMGQTKKALVALAYIWIVNGVLATCTFGFGLIVLPVLPCMFAYDAYLLGQRLQAGESISDVENGLELLNSLPGFK